MTRRRPTHRLLAGILAMLTALTALVVLGTVPAAAAQRCDKPGDFGPVKVRTKPRVPNLVISLAGRPTELSAKGTATVKACRSELVDDLVVGKDPVRLGDRRRVRYDRMFVTDSGRSVTLAFHVEYLTDVQLNGLPSDEIDTFTLRSSTGQVIERTEQGPLWLWGSRVIRGVTGLQLRDIYYTVDSVMAHETNIVNKSQIKFFPRTTPDLQVDLLTYQVELQARDRIFGFPVGSTAYLEAVDGTVIDVQLQSGDATLNAVPRGTYILSVDAPGLNISRPLSVSRNQIADLAVLTWLDIGVLLGLPAALAIFLLLAPRPGLRDRLAFWRLGSNSPRLWHSHGTSQNRPTETVDLSTGSVGRSTAPNSSSDQSVGRKLTEPAQRPEPAQR